MQKISKFMILFKYETFSARQDVRAPENYHEKSDKIDSVIFMHYLLKIMNFLHVHASARTPDKRAEKFDKCRCVLHLES